ncbi:MAG: glutathione peroxidase [Phycisphaerales bacterium]
MMCCCKNSMGSKIGAGAMIAIFLPAWLATHGHQQSPAQKDGAAISTVAMQVNEPANKEKVKEKKVVSKDVLGYEMEMIDGTTQSLEQFRGKVVLMVNVASKCGLTPQYEGLEVLYRQYEKDGLVVIGFPANDFNGQEPGTNEDIKAFCTGKYDVTFPMAAKIHVKGKEAHPLYKQLAAQPKPIGGAPEWNFAKFLVNRKGEVVERYPSRTPPTDEKLIKSVEKLLFEDD